MTAMNRAECLKIVHSITSIASSTGGPARSVAGLCEALAGLGHQTTISTLDTRKQLGPDFPVKPSVAVARSRCLFIRSHRQIVPIGYGDALFSACRKADILHSHGLWEPVNHVAARTAARLKIPHVISPRGSLQKAALTRSGWKKTIAGAIFAKRAIASADCIHAASMLEARHAAIYHPRIRSIAVVPNGLELAEYEEFDENSGRQVVEARWPELKGRNIVLFLGRLHPHKGTVELAEAWAKTLRNSPDKFGRSWLLVFAGPDLGGHTVQIRQFLADCNASSNVLFTGEVTGEFKLGLLALCSFLVLPSASENFGLSVAESLASARPVVVNESSPWHDLGQAGCGLIAGENRGKSLADCIAAMMSLSDSDLTAMGLAGRRFVQARFAWPLVAEMMASVYYWLTAGGPRPRFVFDTAELLKQ